LKRAAPKGFRHGPERPRQTSDHPAHPPKSIISLNAGSLLK
jgi:hypothetical protein